jgi:flagellin-specific chaperone FliS|tara:strand:- start:1011 stop:1133 length:123 start_codon:yes stop_codon:yes gene_type:complete
MDNSMKVEIKVLFDTDEPKDERLIQQVIDIIEELKERLDD